jgi:hypothetical protein
MCDSCPPSGSRSAPSSDHRRPARAPNRRNPGGSQSPEPCGREHRSGLRDDFPGADVATPRADVRAALDRTAHFDLVVILDNILDGDDSIGAFGHDPARRDTHRLSKRESRCCRLAGRNPARDPKPPGRVSGSNGVAVHRRAGKRRQVDHRPGRLGEHPAGRFFERNALGRKRPRALHDQALSLVDRQQISHASRIS